MTIKEYLNNIIDATRTKLIESDSIYSGRDGHVRFAHEVGYALNDFNRDEQEEFLHISYSSLYVRVCFLRPLLNAREWVKLLQSQIKKKKSIGNKIKT